MWFNSSNEPLSAAVILALTTREYLTAGILFVVGLMERKVENEDRDVDLAVRRYQEEED